MAERSFEGGCLCGAIRYVSTAPPVRCVICHCESCRKHSGAPCLSFVHFPLGAFKWIGDEPTRFRSSDFAERGFCPECGSTLDMHEEVLSDRVQVTLGSMDDPGLASPDDHVWTRSRIPWFEVADTIPRYELSSPAADTKAEQE